MSVRDFDKMTSPLEKRFTEPEAMRELNVKSRLTLWRWRRRGLLGYYKIGPNVYYGLHHIKEFISRCEKKAKEVRA